MMNNAIQSEKVQTDDFFAYCLMRDIIDGLNALHSSPAGYHGMVTSANCLADEMWQVKISNFGLRYLRRLKKLNDDDLLWAAPEVLRDSIREDSRSGDVYSLVITCSELICLTPLWNLGERKERSADLPLLFVGDPTSGRDNCVMHDRAEDGVSQASVKAVIRAKLSKNGIFGTATFIGEICARGRHP
ncbi:unnamed protein product [Toxocara canis]|uniref:guanylate cyclase n=1 Tax=Toxocara canis TaxID=6265 RepID=A0A183U3C6_TOXCA|nr:unnamed protein product [Toxocara canis]